MRLGDKAKAPVRCRMPAMSNPAIINAQAEGSGTTVPPGVVDPSVILSYPVLPAVPAKLIDLAKSERVAPGAAKLQSLPFGSLTEPSEPALPD